jgi:hypothetical protein
MQDNRKMRSIITYRLPSENTLKEVKLRRIRWMGPQSGKRHINLLQRLN